MKILHIFPNEKFTEPYIDFINRNFDPQAHYFLIVGRGIDADIKPRGNVCIIPDSRAGSVMISKHLRQAEKIILHSLLYKQLVLVLFLHPWLLEKCYWVIWGADLYKFRESRKSVQKKSYEWIRAFIIKRFGHIISLVEGDYALAKEWYHTKGIYHHGAYSALVTPEFLDSLPANEKGRGDPVCIQIGNSADASNNHLDALYRLEEFKQENIKIFVPLSYGDEVYARQVIEEGSRIFGDKFVPLTEFLSPGAYSQYLNTIDLAIFNNDRQQALGNIYMLLYLNKKVFIRSGTAMTDHFPGKFGIVLEDVQMIDQMGFSDFINHSDTDQRQKISCVFKDEYLKGIWNPIFHSPVSGEAIYHLTEGRDGA